MSSSTSVAPPNANSIGMESEGKMIIFRLSTGEMGGVDARPLFGESGQGE